MITEKIRKAIAHRATVNDEWDYGVQQSQKAILSIISESPDDTIHFIENECTAEGHLIFVLGSETDPPVN